MSEILTRSEASEAVEAHGWRLLLTQLVTSVPVTSLVEGVAAAAAAVEACADQADDHLRVELRPDRVELTLQTRALGSVTSTDTELAATVTRALAGSASGSPTTPPAGGPAGRGQRTGIAASAEPARPVQMLEIAVDALDIAAVRPFWAAVMSYVDEPGPDGPTGSLVDPAGLMPAVWFQQMEEPRPQRNRIHLDLTVAHDEAPARVQAALAAGGVLVSDAAARSFWILADVEGNEVCICTWQDRDGRGD